MSCGRRWGRRLTGVLVVAALTGATVPGPPALAEPLALVVPTAPSTPSRPHPPTPTAAQVRQARVAAQRAAGVLRAARRSQVAAQHDLDLLDASLELSVERWDAARADASASSVTLRRASAAAADARRVADLAQRDVDRLASDSYQLGADLSGGLGEWAAVVDSVFRDGGIQDLADRTSSLGLVAADHRHRMMSAADLQLHAVQAELVASSAASALAQREVTVLAAAEAVRAETVVQRDEVRRLTAVRDAATLTLRRTHARATTLHAARAAALARAAAAARAAADARRARAARRDPDTSGQAWPDGTSTASRAQRLAALAFAEAQLGDPYVAGADGPDAYDCSGLTSAAYRSVGIAMVQYSQTQFVSYRKVPISQLQPGDLVFFGTDPSNWHTIHHVGIYAGGGQMVEAPHTGDVVKFFTIWQDQLVAFGARP